MVSYDCIWIKICVSIWDCQLDKIYLVSSPNPWGFSHAAWNAIAKTTCVRRACQTQSIPAFSIVNPEWFSTISIDKYHMCHCIHLFGFTNQKKDKTVRVFTCFQPTFRLSFTDFIPNESPVRFRIDCAHWLQDPTGLRWMCRSTPCICHGLIGIRYM